MATIANLYKSISEMSDDELFIHIRNIRALRREIPIKSIKKATKKVNKKQVTIDEHIESVKEVKREELLKRLLEIKGRRAK